MIVRVCLMFESRKQTAILVIGLLMAADFALFAYMPSRKNMKELRGELADQKSVIEQASGRKKQVPAVRQRLGELQKQLASYQLNIPSRRELGEFLHNVANLMSQQKLRDQHIEPGDEISAGDLRCIPVRMRCKGKLSQVFAFYRQLEKLDRLVRIQQVRLVNDRDFGGLVNMETKAVIYYRKSKERG